MSWEHEKTQKEHSELIMMHVKKNAITINKRAHDRETEAVRCGVEEALVLFCCCASVGSCLPTFRDSISLIFKGQANLSSKIGPRAVPKVGKQLPI